ncbi:hypothetical protein GCM10027275_43760 [Rhabdobacter roseus]
MTVVVLAILFFAFGILNTLVSLKYETADPDDCISSVTGYDLCYMLSMFEILLFLSFIIGTLLLVFRRRILR